MGTIRIGQKGGKAFFYPGAVQVQSGTVKKREYSPEEKKKLLDSIEMMPKSKWVQALRSAGLKDEADACELALAEEQRHETYLKILDIADERKRLEAFIANGFADDAKRLSEEIAERNAAIEELNDTDAADAEAETTEAVNDAAPSPLDVEEPASEAADDAEDVGTHTPAEEPAGKNVDAKPSNKGKFNGNDKSGNQRK